MTPLEDVAGGVVARDSRQPVPVRRQSLAASVVEALSRYGIVVVTGRDGVGKSFLLEQEVYPACSRQFSSRVLLSDELLRNLESFEDEFVPKLRPPVLLVVDDGLTPESFPDALLSHRFHVIVVSRDPAARWQHLAKVVEVGPFSRAESIQFLTTNVVGLGEEEADRLAAHLGDLPRALEGALRWFTPDDTGDSFLEKVRTHPHLMYGEGSGYLTARPASLMEEVRLKVNDVPDGGRLAPRDVLGALALMDGAPFPVSSLACRSERPGWRSALNELPADRRTPLYGLAAVFRDLERRGLVTLVDGEVRMVWLTCQLVRSALSPNELERAGRLAEVMLLGNVPDGHGEALWGDWPCWEASAAALNAIDPAFLTTSAGRYALLAGCEFLLERGCLSQVRDRLLVLRATWRRAEGVPLDIRLRVLDLLTRTTYQLGDARASCRYGETAYRARLAAYGPRRLDSTTLAGAAQWALAAGWVDWLEELWQLAESIPDQRLARRIECFAMQLRVRSPYGPCLVEQIERIVRAQSDTIGPEHPYTLVTMDLLARAHRRSGQPEDALTWFERTLELRGSTLGPWHPDTRASALALYEQRRELGRKA
ncbi:tetratricopeptide repeat protein [Streptomyces sp. NPDC094032]|uniref:tetratricopeptide repeat protein n=1 Tax=Streptomyces sp. NPDC094032 TaxID=3155308 RepID=UPI003322BE87